MNANEMVSCGGAGRAALPSAMPSPVSRLASSAPNWANACCSSFGTNEYDSAWAFLRGKLRFALGDAIERGLDGLPPGANEAAYCWIEIRPRWNSWIEFYGDAPSDLEDPCFWAKAGETYRVTLLIGKTYDVECSRAVEVVGRSDARIEVTDVEPNAFTVVWPVGFTVAEGRAPEPNWQPDSRLDWKIPIGWHRIRSNYFDGRQLSGPDYEHCDDVGSRKLLVGDRTDKYMQKRHIDESGTYRTDKFDHWISRSRWCRVILDGMTLQWTHLW